MIRLSANLGFLWPDRPLLERIDAAAAAGFEAIELHWPYDVPAATVRARCAAHGLQLLGLNTVRGDAARGEFGLGAIPGREAAFQASVDQAIEYCVEAGGVAVHCMAGKVEAADRKIARAVFMANLRQASEKAKKHEITLLLEPINQRDAPGYFYSTVAEGTDIISGSGCSNLRLMFDCYHVGVAEGDVLAKLAQTMPVIGHVQVAAVPSRAEPDSGTLDYRSVFSALSEMGYEGWVGAEYKPQGDTTAGLGWIKTIAGLPLASTRTPTTRR